MSTNTYPLFFASTYLTASNASLWTMPLTAATTSILQELSLMIANKTVATRLVTIYAFSSGSAGLQNAVVASYPVPPNDYILLPIPRISGSGATIQGFSDATNAVTVVPIGGKLHVP